MKATKVNAGLAESNGRLLLGIWRDSLHVTCGLTACTPGSAPGLTLGNEYEKNFTLPFTSGTVQQTLNSWLFCFFAAARMGSQLPPTYGYFDRHKFNNTANFVYRTFAVTHSVARGTSTTTMTCIFLHQCTVGPTENLLLILDHPESKLLPSDWINLGKEGAGFAQVYNSVIAF